MISAEAEGQMLTPSVVSFVLTIQLEVCVASLSGNSQTFEIQISVPCEVGVALHLPGCADFRAAV